MNTKIYSSEITPEHVYFNRRQFLQLGAAAGGAALLAACGSKPTQDIISSTATMPVKVAEYEDEFGDPANSYEDITNYNNYYEFSYDKEEVAALSRNFSTRPWTVEVSGLAGKPKTYDYDELTKLYPVEERIYRLRCVEAWSMVIPWMGFPLRKLLKDVEPLGNASFVKFTSVLRPEEMPGQKSGWYEWPYVEGLRLDEAFQDLTILSTGLYGKEMLPQNGAPLRLVVPWKYGFKSIKSIVKIELVEEMPLSLWMNAAPNEYGFYANVNPEVDHPRWSQASERRIGEFGRRETRMFNGYADSVSNLYSDLDLRRNY